MGFEDFLASRRAQPPFANRSRVDFTSKTAVTGWYSERNPGRLHSTIAKPSHSFRAEKHTFCDDCSSSDSDGSVRDDDSPPDGYVNHKIYRAKGESYDYFVYHEGKKITFGDSSMPNRQKNDKARANFNARHRCSEKKDKSKVRSCLTSACFQTTNTKTS